MHQGNLSRRGFLQRSLAALSAAGLPAWYAREVWAADQEKAGQKKNGANGLLTMGAIGIGSPQSRGRAIAHDALGTGRARYVAVCDVDKRHVQNAAEDLKKHPKNQGSEISQYHDFRELLDRKDIDAVTIATPDHWHALVALDALRKGKDVYCEKPLTLTVAEGQALVQAARATGKVFQVGSQQRSDVRFRLACELVRNGRIGKVQTVEARIGGSPTSDDLPVVPVPEGLDWDFWLGPTAKVDYVEMQKGNHTFTRCHYEFRWWYEYSGGKMTDWGAHHLDIAQWALGKDGSGPTAVEVLKATQPSGKPNAYNTHPTFHVQYTYDNGTKLIAMSGGGSAAPELVDKKGNTPTRRVRNTNEYKEYKIGGDENGVLFVGDQGKIFVSRDTILASDGKLLSEPLPADATRLFVSNNHMGNFLDCVKSREKPICDVAIGFSSVTVCHIGVIALRTGKKLKWDPAQQRFDDSEANAMLSRPMRAPWKLEA
jgi:predicted dehydrogenase